MTSFCAYIVCIPIYCYSSVYTQACIGWPYPQEVLMSKILIEDSIESSTSIMAIQWKEPGAKDRLLAAVLAASSNVSLEPSIITRL